MGKGKIIAGVTSQFYHRGFIIAVISVEFSLKQLLMTDYYWKT